MQPMLHGWINDTSQYDSVETLFLENHQWDPRGDIRSFVPSRILFKISTLILSDVDAPAWFLHDPLYLGPVRTFDLHLRSMGPRDVTQGYTLPQVVEGQKIIDSPFEVVHLAYAGPE